MFRKGLTNLEIGDTFESREEWGDCNIKKSRMLSRKLTRMYLRKYKENFINFHSN